MAGDRFNCLECTQEDKIERGCNGEVRWHFRGDFLNGCPERMLQETGYGELLNTYLLCDRWGLMPFEGGVVEQPMYITDSFISFGNIANNIAREEKDGPQAPELEEVKILGSSKPVFIRKEKT